MYAIIVCEPQDGGETESFVCEDELELEYFQEDNDWLVISITYLGA
jgi:hypothetical protein